MSKALVMGFTCTLIFILLACALPILGTENRLPLKFDSGFLSGKPCGPPCFHGIVPGVTDETTAAKILKSLHGECREFNNEARGGFRGITCDSISMIGLTQGSDMVSHIGFKPSDELTVADVIRSFGEPNAVFVTRGGIPEYPKTAIILYYNEIKTSLVLPDQEGLKYFIKPSTPIENIGYSEPELYEVEISTFPIEKWTGYGEYELNR